MDPPDTSALSIIDDALGVVKEGRSVCQHQNAQTAGLKTCKKKSPSTLDCPPVAVNARCDAPSNDSRTSPMPRMWAAMCIHQHPALMPNQVYVIGLPDFTNFKTFGLFI